jgi:hypothetical protein
MYVGTSSFKICSSPYRHTIVAKWTVCGEVNALLRAVRNEMVLLKEERVCLYLVDRLITSKFAVRFCTVSLSRRVVYGRYTSRLDYPTDMLDGEIRDTDISDLS